MFQKKLAIAVFVLLALTASRGSEANFNYTECHAKMGAWAGSNCNTAGFDPGHHYLADDINHIFTPAAADNPPNVLLVFLPGTGANTHEFSHFIERARKVGYHIIVLSYWNQHHLHLSAGCNPHGWSKIHDQICFGEISPNITANNQYGNPGGTPPPAPQLYCNEIHDEFCSNSNSAGERTALADKDSSGNYTVLMDAEDAINHRLTKILQGMSAAPNNTWSQFLVNGNRPDWSKIVLAGSSQGAGHAAFIAKWRQVRRVIMLSGIIDALDYPQASDWPGCTGTPNSGAVSPDWVTDNQFGGDLTKTQWATSLDRFYGLASQRDQDFWLDSERIKTNWDNLRLYTLGASGTYPLIDSFVSTNLQLNGEHGLTIGDAFTCNNCGVCPNPVTAGHPDMAPHLTTSLDTPCNDGGNLSTTDPNRPPIVKAWDYFLANP